MKLLDKSACCVALAFGLALPVWAQDMRSASEKVVACQEIPDSLERLACFEAAAAELSTILATPVPTPAPAVIAEPSIPTAPVVAETATDAPAPIQQAAVESDADSDVPRSSLPSWIPRITFGSDREVEKEPDEFKTTLTRIQRNKLGRHFFTTAEGHVWRQIQIEEIRAPKSLPADVILSQNIMGGLRLEILESKRSYGVLRVE